MTRVIGALTRRGPTLLALGVGLGLAWPRLAELAQPTMAFTIFVIVLGTLLRVEFSSISTALRQPSVVLVVPALAMVGCPLVLGAAARGAGLSQELTLALVLAVAAPPSSGTAAVARMLGLDGAMALVATFAAMAVAPLSVPLLAALFGGITVDPLALAWRLAVLIGTAEGAALLLRRHAAPLLARHSDAIDALVLAALLVFALSTMAGMRARIMADPMAALGYVTLAFAVNLSLQALGALLPGSVTRRATVGLVLGNRNVGLVWSALGTAVTPQAALYFAATQLPIYTLPRLLQTSLKGFRAHPSSERPQPVGEP